MQSCVRTALNGASGQMGALQAKADLYGGVKVASLLQELHGDVLVALPLLLRGVGLAAAPAPIASPPGNGVRRSCTLQHQDCRFTLFPFDEADQHAHCHALSEDSEAAARLV